MQKDLIETYIYLAKRDKMGIKLLTTFLSQNHIPERLTNLSQIPLGINVVKKLEQIIYDNRLNWEPWIESASDYDALKVKLKKRGYVGVPMSSQPEFYLDVQVVNRVSASRVMLQKPS